MVTPGRDSRQRSTWSSASWSTHSPMGTISPVSSAIDMNSIGSISPSSGCSQRTSASNPSRPVSSSNETRGW